ncbi:MAG: sigma-54-dependent Fis family transcriptional regulator [Myxococcales bacterium]|nr:sigma-54-dependent Fis family transcriptional regulator [Myxococcales bacterium]
MGEMLVSALSSKTMVVEHVASGQAALDRIQQSLVDLVVTDVRMGKGMTGIDLTARIHEQAPETAVIVITAFGTVDLAVSAIRAGAYDFVPKPFEPDELLLRVQRALEAKRLRGELRALRESRGAPVAFGDLIGRSPEMEQLFALVDRVAQSSAAALVTGDTGTGKELVARAIHARSRRAHGPFVAVNCAAIPETLLESELFGHTRGAFTDARTARTGLFVRANGGTIFLDEVGELPKALQAKLLRALQEHTVRPVGSDAEVAFDARVIAATNRDLQNLVVDGLFREDLYFRLNVLEVSLPPLRARGNDVLLLAQEFIRRISARDHKKPIEIAPDCARLMLEYNWPGNVRELVNVIERAVALARGDQLTAADLPDRVRQFSPTHVIVSASAPDEFPKLEEIERRYILRVLEATNGHRTRTAEILGLDRKTLYNKLRLYGVGDSGATLSQPPNAPK